MNARWLTATYGVFANFLIITSLSLFVLQNAKAQNQFGQITGLVVDASGGSVPGADISISNQQTGINTKTVTNHDGNYTVTSLLPGTYNVTASKMGFSTITQNGVRLDVAQVARVDISLTVGQVSQEVEVKASGVLLQTENAAIGNVVPESAVVNLPLNGRDYLQLATLVPGTNSAGINQQFFGMPTNNLNINGMRESASSYVIDGADVMEQFTSGTPYTPAPDAIQEFKVETNNMTAEFGGGGAIVNVVLKSGTNRFHGDVFEFLRNDALDGSNYFAVSKPELRQNQFGASLGGPILKNKLFFFGDYQGTRIVQGTTFNSIVPSAAQKGGDFSGLPQIMNPYSQAPLAGNKIPAGDLSPQAAYFLPFFPAANSPGGTYVRTATGSNSVNQFDARIDYQLHDKDLFTLTYGQQLGTILDPGPYPLNGATNGNSQAYFTNMGWTHTFGPSLVNQASFSYARAVAYTTGQGIGGTNDTVASGIGGFDDTSALYPGTPNFAISGFTGLSGYDFLPLPQIYYHYNIGDALTKTIGNHTIQLGGDWRLYSGFNLNGAHSRGDFTFTGTYTGNAFADFLYGVPFSSGRSFPRQLFGIYPRNQDLYVQDTWKAAPRLTIIGGFRWDIIHPPTYMHNTYASTNTVTNQIVVASNSKGQIDTTAQLLTPLILPLFQSLIVPSSSVGLPNSLVYTDWHAFAPRLGIAYQLDHDFVLRAGYGIFYPMNQSNQTVSTGAANPPFIADENSNLNSTPIPDKTLANIFPPTTVGNIQLTPVTTFQIDPHQPDPYIQQWNVALQKSIGGVLSVQAAYVGSKGTKLTFSLPANVPLPGPGDIQSRRFNTFFSEAYYISNIGTSSYNALQMTAETRGWHGLYFLGAYTWGKSLDNQSSDDQGSPVQDPNNIDREWGISDFNLASRFTLASTYDLPFFANSGRLVKGALGGWSLSNIITLQTGPVFTPSIATDPANTGTTMRPDQSGNGNLGNRNIQHWFNYAAFSVPAPYTYGNASRNTVTGPPLKDWDLGLSKSFPIGHLWEETQRLQFRGEFFNFTNTPPFGLPDAGIQDATVGRVLTAGAPREVQFSLKVLF
jgi:hypothetical protein